MMMDELRIAIIGFGSANRALARMLLDKSESPTTNPDSPLYDNRLRLRIGARLVPWRIVCIITRRHGRVCIPLVQTLGASYGIDLEKALSSIDSGKRLDNGEGLIVRTEKSMVELSNLSLDIDHGLGISDTITDAEQTLNLLGILGETKTANIVVEAIPSNPKGDGEPAISFTTKALQSKMHVVSANKSPLAHNCTTDGSITEAYWKLQQLALENNVMYQHESSVMDGVPIFSFWKYTMPHAKLTSIRGCLNGTTTMILSRMEGNLDDNTSGGGETFQQALDAAKDMGIVEEDESLDVDGYDAAVKLRALLVVFTASSSGGCGRIQVPTMSEIHRDSIRNVTREDILEGYANGKKKYRLVASANLVDTPIDCAESAGSGLPTKKWEASVKLELLPPSDPLCNMSGTDASVTFCTDVLGPVTVVSSEPTLVDTAYGLFSDIVRVAKESN